MTVSTLVPLTVAALCGAALGFERGSEGKSAGTRTFLILSLGAALATRVSVAVAELGTWEFADPGRISAQIVSGIGFLGAGVILQARGSVRGITTAATLWVAAMVGMAAGAEAYGQAVYVTLLSLAALRGFGWLEDYLERKPRWHLLDIVWEGNSQDVDEVMHRLTRPDALAYSLEGAFVNKGQSGFRVKVRATKEGLARLVFALGQEEEIVEVRTT